MQKLILPVFTAVLFAACPAQAQTATSNLEVTMTITAGCSVTAGTLAFGTQSSLLTAVDQTGSFTVTCTNTTPYNVAMNAGLNGASVTTRRMRGGATNAEYMSYLLYSNASRTNNWGQTIGTDAVAGIGNGAAQTLTVYGRVPAQPIGSPGSYTDTVLITVTF